MKELLKGCIDLHLHAGPSTAAREVDTAEMMRAALEYGYRAYVVKDHMFPTVMSARLIEAHMGQDRVRAFGGIVLNNSVGGINLKAAATACEMGAKFVCMPTASAANHLAYYTKGFPGGAESEVPERPMRVADDDGDLLPEVCNVIEYISRHPQVVLMTGHGTVEEVDAVVREAHRLGVRSIHVNHPYHIVGASIDKMAEWAELGAYIELNACLIVPESKIHSVDLDLVQRMLVRLPMERLVLCSDLGQKGNLHPADGLLRLMEVMMKDAGLTEAQVRMMTCETPAKILGID